MKAVGVLCDHGERLVPGAAGLSFFFDALEREGATVCSLSDAEVRQGLAGLDAVLLGSPHAPLPEEVRESLRAWLQVGGRLLVTGGAGGDRPPGGQTNLSGLVPGLAFNDDVVHFGSEMESFENLVVPLDATSFAPRLRGVRLDFIAGCTLTVSHGIASRSYHVSGEFEPLVFQRPAFDELDRLHADEEGEATQLRDPVYAELAVGRGLVVGFGSTDSFHDNVVKYGDNRAFLDHVLFRWLHRGADRELSRRLREPQRHRLLQGYPMVKLMIPDSEPLSGERCPRPPRRLGSPPEKDPYPGQHRPAIVGVLPHPYCNPTVRGCGFCTFPQEKLARDKLPTLVEAVRGSIAAFRREVLHEERRAIPALYFGGGTANLTPPEGFRELCAEVARTFDTGGSEVTLEGVPRYFGIEDRALMRTVRETFPTADARISMGIQTFDRVQIERMGRAGFGDREEIERLVRDAHDLGFSVSCDLLVNLPGQTLGQMLEDLTIAAGAGFDQICVYHLVLFEGLGTPWSEDRSLLSLLAGNPAAYQNQRRCLQHLYELGFSQATLTNFERRTSPRPAFRYEPLGFRPDETDLLGFGPAGISLATDEAFRSGWKTVGAQDAAGYLAGEQRGFFFGRADLQLLFLTRSIAGLRIDLARYRALFGCDLADDFGMELDALLERGLVRERPGALDLSTEGMFYADSVAGLFAWRRVQIIRDRLEKHEGKRAPAAIPHVRFRDPNMAGYGGMG